MNNKKTTLSGCLFVKVIRSGFEPETHSLEGCCSIQLSYQTKPFRGAKVRINEQKTKFIWIFSSGSTLERSSEVQKKVKSEK